MTGHQPSSSGFNQQVLTLTAVGKMAEYSIWILEFVEGPDAATSALVFGRHNGGAEVLPCVYTLLKGHGKAVSPMCRTASPAAAMPDF